LRTAYRSCSRAVSLVSKDHNDYPLAHRRLVKILRKYCQLTLRVTPPPDHLRRFQPARHQWEVGAGERPETVACHPPAIWERNVNDSTTNKLLVFLLRLCDQWGSILMPRPVSIQDEVILRAARKIFLEKGWDATTSEIASTAGVSQGIIFKRFKTKQALFQRAMQEESDWGQSIPALLKASVGKRKVDATLIELGALFVEKFLTVIPTLMMSWSNRPEDPLETENQIAIAKERASRALHAVKTIAGYLKDESRLGRIRQTNFEVVAQAFVGALWHHAFLQVMMGNSHAGRAEERRYVRRLVRIIWSGIEPK
jgi:AcrR family transcriptional regulator